MSRRNAMHIGGLAGLGVSLPLVLEARARAAPATGRAAAPRREPPPAAGTTA